MQVKKIKVLDSHGLHLREAARIVRASQKFKSKIRLSHGNHFADALSILEILSLAVLHGGEVEIITEGPDEQEAVVEMAQVFEDGAGI